MAKILTRDEKVAKLKVGPGVFVYDGKALDHVDAKGKGHDGRPAIVQAREPMKVRSVRGVDFEAGKPVEVADAELALKLRGMAHFEEVEAKAKKQSPAV